MTSIKDRLPTGRIFQGHIWTVFSARIERLEKMRPQRAYYAPTEELWDELDKHARADRIPSIQRDKLALLDWNGEIQRASNKPGTHGVYIIFARGVKSLKEIVWDTRLGVPASQWGTIPLFRVFWSERLKNFEQEWMTEASDAEEDRDPY